jgi:hypothetical protein
MRFMTLWRPSKPGQPSEKLMSDMGKFIQDSFKSGVLVQTGGWDPRSPFTLVKSADGRVTVTDGPYAESKELIAGFALLEVKSKEEAIEVTRRFVAIAGDGTSEVHEVPSEPPKAR